MISYTDRLYGWKGGCYDLASTEDLFLKAMRENTVFHYRHNHSYRRLLETAGWDEARIRAMADPAELPPVPTLFLKRNGMWTLPSRQMLVKATSSGTGGIRSQVGYDGKSILRGAKMTWRLGQYHQLFSLRPANYLMLGFKPHPSNHTVIVKTQRISSMFAPPLHRTYALTWGKRGYEPDPEKVLRALFCYARMPFPVRIIGFPFYLHVLLEEMEKRDMTCRLPFGSRVFLGGGWKQHAMWSVDPDVLYRRIERQLGIPETACVEFFGAAEHPSLYCSCSHHHFHVPVYSRVVIRDVNTLEPLGYDQPGILNLITPLARSMPLGSILTDDIAVWRRAETCGCGISSPFFKILGRAEATGVKTCAGSAADILRDTVLEGR